MAEFVTTENLKDVVVVEINRPKVNALSKQVLNEIAEVFAGLSSNPPGAVVLWGGEKCFSAGADVEEFDSVEQGSEMAKAFRAACDAIANFPRVVVAAVSGYALGGGAELALACDIRVMGDTATIGFPEVKLGIIPGGGATQRLPRLVGASRAAELLLTGDAIDANAAELIGLANHVTPDAAVFGDSIALATEFSLGAGTAQGAIKQLVNGTLSAGLDSEAAEFSKIFATQDAKVGLAHFRERKDGHPDFKGE